jgi:nitrile hydratase subunit beta
VETGLITAEELASGTSVELAPENIRNRLLKAVDVAAALTHGSSAALPADTAPRFQVGDRVRGINRHPLGHTREPRYVRGRVGVIHEYHGAHVFPDLSAEGVKSGRHLYGVRFEAAELWGENANGNSAVYVDLWEDYLEPA